MAARKKASNTIELGSNGSRSEIFKRKLNQLRFEEMERQKHHINNKFYGRMVINEGGDEADQASAVCTEALIVNRGTMSTRKLHNIDEALRKIDEGVYGNCEECGDEIPTARLVAQPFAIRCRDCQEEYERREKHEGGSGDEYEL